MRLRNAVANLPVDLEGFPHAIAALVGVWGTLQFDDTIDGMTMDWIRCNRRGWPEYIFRDLVFLRDIHHEAYPALRRKLDPWDVKGVGISK